MDWQNMLFQDWTGIVRTALVGSLAYITLILFLRISGKQTLAKLNAFDLVVTVALGATLSAILLQESIALAEGATALALLIGLQYLVTFESVRSAFFARIVRPEPTLLVRNGAFCHGAMLRERTTEDDAMAAIRSAGRGTFSRVKLLILESDGTLSTVLQSSPEL